MKKIKLTAFLLAVVMAFALCAGCGSDAGGAPTGKDVTAENGAEADKAGAGERISYELAAKKTPVSKDFACVISKSGEVNWEIGVTDFEKLAAGLTDSGEYQCVEVLPDNGEEYPYLYPDGEWKMYIMDSEIADWFTEDSAAKVSAAFEEWRDKVYGILDVGVLFDIGDPQSIEVSEAAITADVQALLDDWYDVDTKWMTCNVRNSVPTTSTLAVGKSVADDAWNYVYNKLWTQTGEDLAGHSQVDLIAALVGSAFTGISDWEGYVGLKTGYPFESGARLLKAGYFYMDGLFSEKEIKELDNKYDPGNAMKAVKLADLSPSTTGGAFACVVDEDLNAYWQFGIDYCSGLLSEFGLDAKDVVQINLTPSTDLLYSGQTYFVVSSDLLSVVTLGNTPSWYEAKADEVETLVKTEFDKWQKEINEAVDVDGMNHMLLNMPTDAHTEMTAEVFDTFKEWVTLWNEVGVAGYINIHVTSEGWETVGSSIWDNMFGLMSGNYKKMNHEGCPGPTADPVISAYARAVYGKNIDSATSDYIGNTMNDSFSANIASYIYGIERDGNGDFKYQSAVDLWEAGVIPFFDGEYWYLVSGPDGDVQIIFSATNEQMMDDSFTFKK